jgi:hypothetical protein
MASHAQLRAQERYGIDGELPFKLILDTIREGKATKVFHVCSHPGLIYDVPLDCPVYTGILRVIVRPTLDWVITVVPPETPGERAKKRIHDYWNKQAAKRREFHRGMRSQGNDDE